MIPKSPSFSYGEYVKVNILKDLGKQTIQVPQSKIMTDTLSLRVIEQSA